MRSHLNADSDHNPLLLGMASKGTAGTRNTERSTAQLPIDAMLEGVRLNAVDK